MDPKQTTEPTAAPTAGQDNPIAAPGSGVGTDPTQPSQDVTQEGKAKAEPKFTDADMRAARKAWETQAEQDKQKAAQEAQQAEALAQGKAQEVAKERLETIKAHEATIAERDTLIASLSTHVNADIDMAIKHLPPTHIIRKFDPGADNLAQRMEWYAKVREDITATQKSTQGYGANGYAPQPSGNTQAHPVNDYISRTYANQNGKQGA